VKLIAQSMQPVGRLGSIMLLCRTEILLEHCH